MSEKGGAITLAPVRQLARLLRIDPDGVYRYLMARTTFHPRYRAVARFACRILQFHRILPLIANPILRLGSFFRRKQLEPGATEIVEVREFDEEIDELCERTRDDYPVIFPRERRFLNWRFGDEVPHLKYRRFVARRDGRITGYLVLRIGEPNELPVGVIVDLYAARHDRETVEDLIRHSLRTLGPEVCSVTGATSVPEYAEIYRRFGFRVIRTERPTCVCHDAAIQERLAELRDRWFFSKGDHDWDQIHLA
jgi:hypothetical protein